MCGVLQRRKQLLGSTESHIHITHLSTDLAAAMAVQLCLQVAKYSFLDYPNASSKGRWTHMQHNNLAVLLKGNETSGAMVMTIVSGTSTLVSAE